MRLPSASGSAKHRGDAARFPRGIAQVEVAGQEDHPHREQHGTDTEQQPGRTDHRHHVADRRKRPQYGDGRKGKVDARDFFGEFPGYAQIRDGDVNQRHQQDGGDKAAHREGDRTVGAGGTLEAEPEPPHLHHEDRDRQQHPAQPAAALQARGERPDDVGHQQQYEQVGEDRGGEIEGHPGQGHADRADVNRHGDAVDLAETQHQHTDSGQQQVGQRCRQRFEVLVGLDHHREHQQRPAHREHGSQRPLAAIAEPTPGEQPGCVGHAQNRADMPPDDLVIRQGPQQQSHHHDEADRREPLQQRGPTHHRQHRLLGALDGGPVLPWFLAQFQLAAGQQFFQVRHPLL